MCVLSSLQLLIVPFLILRRTGRDMIQNVYWFSGTRYSCQIIKENWIFSAYMYFRNFANAPKTQCLAEDIGQAENNIRRKSRFNTATYRHSNVFRCFSFLPIVRSNKEIFIVTSNKPVLYVSQNLSLPHSMSHFLKTTVLWLFNSKIRNRSLDTIHIGPVLSSRFQYKTAN
jgi:hypothetical protein